MYGGGYVRLPEALARKYPEADRLWGWQWIFPAARFFTDPATGRFGPAAFLFQDYPAFFAA
jgi:hypothetical protein